MLQSVETEQDLLKLKREHFTISIRKLSREKEFKIKRVTLRLIKIKFINSFEDSSLR